MARQYLNVPFARKEEAKLAGARWDKANRRWYWPTMLGELPESLRQFAHGEPAPRQEPAPRSKPAPRREPTPRRESTPGERGPRVDLHFDSIAAAISACLHSPLTRGANAAIRQSHFRRSDSMEWFGVEGGGTRVLSCLRDGHPEGAARIEQFLATLDDKLPIATGVNRVLVRGDAGDHLDVHAMYRGQLDRAWSSSKRRLKKSTGLIRICVDICANAGTHADTLAWRGVAGAAMARVLEKARYSVEIAACMALERFLEHNAPSIMTSTFIVKPKAGRVDLDRLACTIGLAGFFRIVGFAAVTKASDDLGQIAADNLGWYADASGLIPPDEKVTTLWVPQAVCDAATATQWVRDTVSLLQAAG